MFILKIYINIHARKVSYLNFRLFYIYLLPKNDTLHIWEKISKFLMTISLSIMKNKEEDKKCLKKENKVWNLYFKNQFNSAR